MSPPTNVPLRQKAVPKGPSMARWDMYPGRLTESVTLLKVLGPSLSGTTWKHYPKANSYFLHWQGSVTHWQMRQVLWLGHGLNPCLLCALRGRSKDFWTIAPQHKSGKDTHSFMQMSFPTELFGRLNRIMYIKHLTECLAQDKSLRNV